jgi:uncharacterized surface protein with fasciclin (FAS1) repeats
MDSVKNVGAQPTKNIVETAVAAGTFATLAAGLKAADLITTLSGKGPFTVFAPTDEAFKKLPHGALDALLKDTAQLKSVLTYHVVSGHVMSRDIKSGDVKTVEGSLVHVSVSGTHVEINGAHVSTADIMATNGVIHVIDAVLLPKSVTLATAA